MYAGRKVADADLTTDKAGTVESAKPMILREPLGEFDTGLRRRKPFTNKGTPSPRAFRSRRGSETMGAEPDSSVKGRGARLQPTVKKSRQTTQLKVDLLIGREFVGHLREIVNAYSEAAIF